MHAKRHMTVLAGVAAALAIAAPIAGASDGTTPGASPDFVLPAYGGLPEMDFYGPSVGGFLYAQGSPAVDDVLNGPTVVQIANGSAESSIIW